MLPRVAEDNRVVVIGSGPPGAAAAVFLSRAGADVLLLEAGSEKAAGGLTVRVGGYTVFRYGRALKLRERTTATADPAKFFEELAPGGLTNHWSCAVPRFSTEDFVDAARAGEAHTWPIDYADLEPWYDRVEPLLHIAGNREGSPQFPNQTVAHYRRLAEDWTPLASLAERRGRTLKAVPYAYGGETTVTLSGSAFNSFVRLVQPELRAGYLKTVFDARVVRLEWSAKKRRVEAVVYRDTRTGAENRVACRGVVLAAGAIATATILLQSSSPDFPNGLGNEHGVLGHYLHDHPIGKLIVELGRPLSVDPPAFLTRPTLDRAPPLYAASCLQWGGTATVLSSLLGTRPGRARKLGFNMFGTMAPSHENFVSLGPSSETRGGDGAASLNLHVRWAPESRACLESARDDLLAILQSAGHEPSTKYWEISPLGDANHYGGVCRMHASPRFGMLDGWNRMHAVPNVAVVDSAAFTTGPEKNPVLTAMTLAARASSRLADELKGGDL
jgi:choline dehydrogenase-like flavoprotein